MASALFFSFFSPPRFKFSTKSFSINRNIDTITCLSLNPKGTHLLSNSMDGTLRTWDVRPFVDDAAGGKKRHDKTFLGGTHNAEKGLLNCAWSSDGTMVTGGSADCVVHIWDEFSAEEVSTRMNSELLFIFR